MRLHLGGGWGDTPLSRRRALFREGKALPREGGDPSVPPFCILRNVYIRIYKHTSHMLL